MYSKFGLANWICLAKWGKLVGEWPMADCYFKLCVCENYGYSFKNVLKSFWYRYCEYITITAWSNAGHSEKAVRGADTGYKRAATVKGLLVWRTPLLPTVD